MTKRRTINPRTEVQYFSRAMESKLKKNDHKKHWSNLSPGHLVCRLEGETKELRAALDTLNLLYKFRGRSKDRSPLDKYINRLIDDVQQEAADVANFAMMVWDNIERERKSYEATTY